MAVKRKILAALAALALAGGIAVTAVPGSTASAGGPVATSGVPVATHGGSGGGLNINPGADVWPYDAD
jgi:hypothetical protein